MLTVQMKKSFQTPEGRELFHKMYGEREGMLISQIDRYTRVARRHKEHFPNAGEVRFFSAPGRTEIVGNHTDHNGGRVLAAAVNLDTIAAVSVNEENAIHIFSEGYPGIHIDLSDLGVQESEMGTTAALARGIAAKLKSMNVPVAGFNATMTSNVLGGSGLSSSAAVEVLFCTIMDCLFQGGKLDPKERAQIAQYAENVYFGKPCGLMDQMASSVGGLVTIDFKGKTAKVESLSYDFAQKGYALVVVGPGGSHDDLTDAYGAIRKEMEQVAACFGDKVLRSVRPEQVEANIGMLREKVSDRAILRSLHFFDENQRVLDTVTALAADDFA
ncbi:MAG TPA: galactokinase family protein, partial [Clostridia bacterium]|nr:galactokinase family protein [Clostridia bacterium]